MRRPGISEGEKETSACNVRDERTLGHGENETGASIYWVMWQVYRRISGIRSLEREVLGGG